MAREEIERLIGKAVIEPEFLRALLQDPEGAAKKAGITLTDDEIEAIRLICEGREQAVNPGEGAETKEGLEEKLVKLWDGKKPG